MNRVLVIRFSSMGDVVLASSIFEHLKRHYPHGEIHFVTNERYTGLFSDDPRLSSVSGVDDKGWCAQPPTLGGMHWDLIIDLQNNGRSARLCRRFFPDTPVRRFDKLHMHRFLLLMLRLNRYTPGNHIAARYVKTVAKGAGAAADSEPVRLFFKDDGDGVKRLLFGSDAGARPVLALFPFSSWKNKRWPRSSYTEVARYFVGKGWHVVIVGGPDDREEAQNMRQAVGAGCAACAGDRTLYEIGCLLSSCNLALGNDTGLSHLARACGVKSGVIYGSTTWHFGFFPYGEPAFRIFESRRLCRPCHPHGGNVCWRLSRPCLASINACEVIKGLEELYGAGNVRPEAGCGAGSADA